MTIAISKTPPKPTPTVERFSARDALEHVIASVLKFFASLQKVSYKIVSKAGTEAEVDVWNEKAVRDMRFATYASCKSWDRSAEVGAAREEFSRALKLSFIPHVRAIAALIFTKQAKKEALANGFVAVKAGERLLWDGGFTRRCTKS